MPTNKLFANLVFYFYPQKSLSKLHGLRARLSAKNGATIENEPSSRTTHILLAGQNDNGAFWQSVKNYDLRKQCLILNSEWASDSIENGKLMDSEPYSISRRFNGSLEQNELKSSMALVSPLENQHISQTGFEPKRAKRENAIKGLKYVVPQMPPKIDSKDTSIGLLPFPKETRNHISTSENQILVDIFRDLMLSRRVAGEEYSASAYERALRAIEKCPVTIKSGVKFRESSGISLRMARLIDDIRAGLITQQVIQGQRNRIETTQLFTTVYGVGPVNARIFYNQGCRTLEDLAKVVDRNGQVSIDHHQDFVERMSRSEVAQHFEFVERSLRDIDSDAKVHCMGSYRRGQLDCGDVDIIMTRPDTDLVGLKKVLKELLKTLFATNFAQHTFAKGSDRWLGATQVTGKWRRMDILLVPIEQIGAAMIYYTGDDQFNRKMRLLAKKNNMRLNNNGLFKVETDENLVLLEARDEKRIFEILKQPYLPPEKRIHL